MDSKNNWFFSDCTAHPMGILEQAKALVKCP